MAREGHTAKMAKRKQVIVSPRYVKPSKPIITRTKRKTKTIEPQVLELAVETKHRQSPVVVKTGIVKQEFVSIASQLRDIGSLPDDKTKRSKMYAMLLRAFDDAVSGDPVARSFIADRTEGRAVQRQMIQNIDILNKVVNVLERVIVDPLPDSANSLLLQIAYELDKISKAEEEQLKL